jgi:serine phosphatase RsbU (regulator of sigma subunit)/Tfp pilus assembly protein PilF
MMCQIMCYKIVLLSILLTVSFYPKAQGKFEDISDSIDLYLFDDSIQAKKFIQQLEGIALTPSEVGKLHIFKGWYHEFYNDYGKAFKMYSMAHEAYAKGADLQGVANAYGNIANVYDQMGQFKQAIEFHNKALLTNEKILDGTTDSIAIREALYGKSSSLANMGGIYFQMGDSKTAIVMLEKSLAIDSSLNDIHGMGICYQMLGINFRKLKDLTAATHYFQKSLEIYTELDDKVSMTHLYINMGNLFMDLNQYDKAKNSFLASKKLSKEISDFNQLVYVNNGLALVYLKEKQFDQAESLLMESIGFSLQQNSVERTSVTASLLADLYETTSNWEKAYHYLKLHITLKDSVYSAEAYQELGKSEQRIQFEMQTYKDSIAFEQERIETKKEALRQHELIQKQSYIIYLSVAGLGLVVMVAVLLFRGNVAKKRANAIISLQKQEVEAKNKEITDSINYAKRIQEAILPTMDQIKVALPNSFIVFMPKDVVSGDFYWFEKYKNVIYIAAADCTGHGVPGAMVSVICSNALSKALLEEGITEPSALLDRTRELVIQRFAKSGTHVMDGMDISLLSLTSRIENDKESESEDDNSPTRSQTHTVLWSGANNPLWVVRNGAGEVEEFKPDKQPIANFGEMKPFSQHEIQLNPGDTMYLFSDGFADQFGGANHKKFMYKNMKKLLIQVHPLTMEKQKEFLINHFLEWRGALEQLDDVCIVGIRV